MPGRRRDGLEPHGRAGRARRQPLARGAHCRGGLDEVEEPLGHGHAVSARMELRPELPDRQVQLGREHEHRQGGLQADSASGQADAHRHGDQATPSVAASSSTDPERKPTRSVPIVVWR